MLELYLFCKPREPIYYIYVFFVETIGRRRYISIIFCFVFPPTSWSKKLEKTRRGCETKKVILAATRANKNCGQWSTRNKKRYFCENSTLLYFPKRNSSTRNIFSVCWHFLFENSLECSSRRTTLLVLMIIFWSILRCFDLTFVSHILALAIFLSWVGLLWKWNKQMPVLKEAFSFDNDSKLCMYSHPGGSSASVWNLFEIELISKVN